MIITDQWNQTLGLYEMVIYSRAICVTVTSKVPCKEDYLYTWTGTLANSADPDQTELGLHCLLRSVYHNN